LHNESLRRLLAMSCNVDQLTGMLVFVAVDDPAGGPVECSPRAV
jgi:hypothetical protein